MAERLLYATGARFGVTGLDLTSRQDLIAAHRAGVLAKGVGFANEQTDVPARFVRSLGWHPVRLLSFLESSHYYGAKRRYVDWIAARELERGGYSMFHGWSGDSLLSMIAARQRGLRTFLNIPTWHRNKGHGKPFETKSEREARVSHARGGWKAWVGRLPIDRQRMLLEYELADQILVQSTYAAETFLAEGVPADRIAIVARGVDAHRYHPAERAPEKFRAIFAGALIRRKGVHLILEAWRKLALKDAELVLAGAVHPEIEPALKQFAGPDVVVKGFSKKLEDELRAASVFVFPSECEGWAKVTFEAMSSGLPMIATRESGDSVIEGVTGYRVPANDVNALADALRRAWENQDALRTMGLNARQRMVNHYTWDHYHQRLALLWAGQPVQDGPAAGF